MNSCRACTEAETNPLTGSFCARCLECQARSIAAGQVYFESVQARAMTDAYRNVLDRVFDGGWQAGNERVRHWFQKTRDFRRNANQSVVK